MRLLGALVGGLFFLAASEVQAVAPIFTETPLRGTPRAERALSLLARKPHGVDHPAAARLTSGRHYRAVVILLQFPPDPGIPGDPGVLADTLAHPPSAYDSLLFGGAQPTGSLRDYYREVSRGTFDIDGVVTRWYTAPHPYGYYTAGQWGFGSPPNNAQQMALDAVQLADPDLDFRLYDNDGPDGIPNSGDDDGFLDALFVVHAGPGGEETATISDDIISHEWSLPNVYTSPDIGAGGSGIKAITYTTEPEKWAGLAPFTTPNQLITIGVFCHEFGHVLGLPDLYDTRSDPAASEGIGEWDLMGSGNYCHQVGGALGSSPAHMSAWCKQRLGWVTPLLPSADIVGATLAPVETGGPVYRLWTDGASTGEYFLIENRQPLGFDAGLVRGSIENSGLPSHGLLIYHVDESVTDNNNPARKLVDVVEAGGVESVSAGPDGVQNLDVHRRTALAQTVCGIGTSVTGNRGDGYDPWPGLLLAGDFGSATCPSSTSHCGNESQVAVRGIAEAGSSVTADIYVEGTLVQRTAPLIDDAPSIDPVNNGNGLAEPGEKIQIRIPLVNINTVPTRPLYAKVASLDPYTTLASSDSIDYGSIAAGAADSGTVFSVTIDPAPDPRGAMLGFSVYSPAGLVRADSLEILVGANRGICDDVEGASRRWMSVPVGCAGPDQWHLDSDANHTPGGSWSWKLGAVGAIGGYSGGQDARLISQPIRLAGVSDTLSFWQRYGTAGVDGLSVEISTNAGASWTIIPPVGGYPFGDRWSGSQPSFTQAKVLLDGYSSVVQIAFRFRSAFLSVGTGWWIDDVFVTGTTDCATTDVAVTRFTGAPVPPGIRLEWNLLDGAFVTLGIDRADEGGARTRIATLPAVSGTGSYEDRGVSPGRSYQYWLIAARDGEAAAEAGPILVEVPVESAAPKMLALGHVRPNPFNPTAEIPVSLDRDGRFTLRIYRVDGTLVRTLHDGDGRAGTGRFVWDGTDDRRDRLGAGIYFFELRSDGRVRIEKAILLR